MKKNNQSRVTYRTFDDDSPLVQASGGIDPITTTLVNTEQQVEETFGESLFRPITTPLPTFKYRVYNRANLVLGNTEVGPDGTYGDFTGGVEFRDGKCKTYAIATRNNTWEQEDADAYANAMGVPTAYSEEYLRSMARDRVRLWREQVMANFALDTSHYDASLVLALAGGQEIDTLNNGLVRISAAFDALRVFNPNLRRKDLILKATPSSFAALTADTTMLSAKSNTDFAFIDEVKLAEYYGIGEVQVRGVTAYADEATDSSPVDLWGDCMILQAPPVPKTDPIPGAESQTVINDSFAAFNVGTDSMGGALEAERERNMLYYPWRLKQGLVSASNHNCYLWTNVAA